MNYVCIMKNTEGLWLMLTEGKNPCILGYKSANEGVLSWENTYLRANGIAACLAFIQNQPSIVGVSSIDTLAKLLVDLTPYRVRGENFSFTGAKLKPAAGRLWERGKKPRFA